MESKHLSGSQAGAKEGQGHRVKQRAFASDRFQQQAFLFGGEDREFGFLDGRRPFQCGYVNMCWSWKRSLGFPISRLWEEMRHQWSTRNAYRRIRGEIEIPKIVFLKTWEDLLSGHPIWFSGTILQLVLGKGLVYQEV